MVFNKDRAFAMTKESKKGQEPEQMNRYIANVTEKAEERRGRKRTVSAMLMTSISLCPTPTVSTMRTSNPMISKLR